MIINFCVGLITPPVGTVLKVGCSVSGLKIGKVVMGILPFLPAEFIFLVLCIIFPQIITWPASWFGYGSATHARQPEKRYARPGFGIQHQRRQGAPL